VHVDDETEELDLRGLGCGSVLMRLAATARSSGGALKRLVVVTDDRGAPEELPAWCRMTKHRYLGPVEGSDDQYRIELFPQSQEESTS
jgi:tRNA 2-thiouridine synthesizing protein A